MKKLNALSLWGGITGFIMLCALGLTQFSLGLVDAKWGNFQLYAEPCKNNKAKKGPSSDECQHLLVFGVEANMYLSDSEYQSNIDQMVRDIIMQNGVITHNIATFTLEHAGNKKVKLAADIIRILKETEKGQASQIK